jgi:hypothetical protein
MGMWDWVDQFHADAMRRGDKERVRLAELHSRAYAFRETDPDQALSIYAEGSQVARVLNEPWWVLFYDDWQVDVLLFYKQDYGAGIDLAVRNVLEVRKPTYAQFPFRFVVHRNLTSAYIGIDPQGHAGDIMQTLDFLEREIPEEGEDKYLISSNRREFYLEIGDFEKSESEAFRMMRMGDEDRGDPSNAVHHSVFNCSDLCLLASKRDDRKSLLQWAEAGELSARRSDLQMQLSEFLIWQAYVARSEGDEERATYLARRATSRAGRLRMPPTPAHFESQCRLHGRGNDLERVLEIRRHELGRITGKGRTIYEVRTWLRICQLLAQLGQPFETEAAGARAAFDRLRESGRYREMLGRIQQGEVIADIW